MTRLNVDLQAMVDEIGKISANVRQQYHLTLGQLLDALRTMEPDHRVVVSSYGAVGGPLWSIEYPHSYWGYYEDLAFMPTNKTMTVKDVLAMAESCLNVEFEGYKGGDFRMHDKTPLWLSCYGEASNIAIMGVSQLGDTVVLTTKKV